MSNSSPTRQMAEPAAIGHSTEFWLYFIFIAPFRTREEPYGKETDRCPRNTHIGPEKPTQDQGLMKALMGLDCNG